MKKVDLKNLPPEELEAFLADLGKARFRTRQILRWIYQRGICDFSQMTDLAKDFRQELAEKATLSEFVPEVIEKSEDGTEKYLFRLDDGETVESVRIPMGEGRSTLCISTQAGCAMQCEFCFTGTFGLLRHLTPAEIVNQVCASLKQGPVNNIVMMGMGEPLHNLDNVVKALKILYSEDGLGFGARRVTLSTCGLIPEMEKLGRQVRVGLAVSLNATTDEVRDRLMPVNKRYPLKDLMAACRQFPLQPREKITFEYILIRGVNDSPADAKRLVKLLHGVKAKVNLIPFNEHPGSDFRAPGEESIERFQTYLLNRKIVTVRRASKGQDISAACGQLKGQMDQTPQDSGG